MGNRRDVGMNSDRSPNREEPQPEGQNLATEVFRRDFSSTLPLPRISSGGNGTTLTTPTSLNNTMAFNRLYRPVGVFGAVNQEASTH
jgi:hypothetical protein